MNTHRLFTLFCWLLPPIGMIWMWFRPSPGIGKKILYSVLMVFWTLVLMVGTITAGIFTGVLEPHGGGITGFYIKWFDEEEHIRQLEESRNQGTPQDRTSVEPSAGSTYWTGFRGPRRDGEYTASPVSTEWPEEGLPLVWKQPCGGGYGSFAIANGLAYTIEQRLENEVVVAYDLATGAERWTHSWQARFYEALGGPGPRSTPTYHEGHLYVVGATGEFWCLDAETGAVIWNTNILGDTGVDNQFYGIANSPLMYEDLVVVQSTGGDGNAVVAYDRQKGSVVWSVLDDTQEYVSAQRAVLHSMEQILTITTERVVGLHPEDGRLLWDFPWKRTSAISIAQPVVLPQNRVFVSGSYGRGCAMIQVNRDGDTWSTEEIWFNRNMKNKLTSSVLYDGYMYGLDESVLVCLDPETGDRVWKAGRYGYGQFLLAHGHLIIITERGDLALVEASPEEHREKIRFPAIEGKTWNVPAISDGYLLVRNTSEMACFRIAPDGRGEIKTTEGNQE